MNIPKVIASIGITHLEAAVLAVMDDEEWLQQREISQRLGIPAYGAHGWNYAIVRGILEKLNEDGRVDRKKKSNNQGIWKLRD